MTQAYDALAAVHAAAEQSQDETVPQRGGGDYTPPAEGRCGLRMVAYVELGKHKGTYLGKPKTSDKVEVVFEVSGVKWPLKEAEDGTKIPTRVTVKLNKSINEKAAYFKLFKAMNWEGSAKTMAQLLGKDFIGTLHHRKYKRNDGTEGIAMDFTDPNTKAFTIGAPFVEDMETGETKRRNIPTPLTEIKVFLWAHATKPMWDSIFIEGEYEEQVDEKSGEVTRPARSKNVWQETIKQAINFTGSAIDTVLTGEVDPAVTETTKPKQDKKARQAASRNGSAAAAERRAAEAAAASGDLPDLGSMDGDDEIPF